MSTSNKKQTEVISMKKSMVLLFTIALSAVALLSSCGGSEGNADTTNPITNQNTNETTNPTEPQNTNEQPLTQEQIAGNIQVIDGMTLTIDTSAVFMATGTGAHTFSGEPVEKEYATVRLTEETTIEVRTTAGGQIIETRVGTLEDLSLQNTVMVEGYWQSDEFVATSIITFRM